MTREPSPRGKNPWFVWSPEQRDRVADLLQAGKTAKQIGEAIGVTRNSIIGIVQRDGRLRSIGFAGTNHGSTRKRELTDEDRRQRRNQYCRAYRATQKTGAIVVPFPKPLKHIKQSSPQHLPKLRVVSNNVPLLVRDWLDRNGGARKFEQTATSDTWVIRLYLEERGIKLNGHRGKWGISTGRGRPRLGTWADVMKIADEFRIAEGLEPFGPPVQASAPKREARG